MSDPPEVRPATPIGCARGEAVHDERPIYGETIVCVDAEGRRDLVEGMEYRLLWSEERGKAVDVETLDGKAIIGGLRSNRFAYNGRRLL